MNIKEQRERIGWTQSQLAEYMGVSERTIQNWEAGETMPSAAQLNTINELARRFERYRDAEKGRSDFSRLISIIEMQQREIERLTILLEHALADNIE
jgi:transcriptional regulator with XRE-family HTH domain